jgi:hypothetical protein
MEHRPEYEDVIEMASSGVSIIIAKDVAGPDVVAVMIKTDAQRGLCRTELSRQRKPLRHYLALGIQH